MKERVVAVRLFVGLSAVALAAGLSSTVQARDVPGLQQIQRGAWQETTPFKSYTVYRHLCVDGLAFISMEGYGWGENSATSSQIIQMRDKSGQPKVCE